MNGFHVLFLILIGLLGLLVWDASVDRGECLHTDVMPVTTFMSAGSTMIPIVQMMPVCSEWEFPGGRP